MNETADDAFAALTSKISRERGFGAANYKDSCMRRRIAVRMRARGAEDYGAYSRLLDSDPAEYEWLIAALTINVTKLFRNAETWDAVARTVLPALWAMPAPRLNCWVAGCASGEEAYTLAALWLQVAEERRGVASRVRVQASDIDPESLAAAETGTYGEASFAETPSGVRERWFAAAEQPARWTAGPELRSLVRFERRDLLSDSAPSGAMHLITCRNVIIYFDRASQDALMRRFHDALVPGGFLVLGKVETLLGASRALFESVDSRQRIFRRPVKEIRVRIAHHAVAKGRSRLVTVGLGSCVAIAIHDRMAKVGGLAHVLLPDASLGRGVENRARYASSAVPLLLDDMKAIGATGPFTASLVGGAALFGPLLTFGGSVGARNVDAARAALAAARVPVLAEDVGGESGRTLFFDVSTGKVKVRSVRGGEHVL